MILLSRLIENTEKNTITEFIDGFDLDTFLKMTSFRKKILYANENLKRISSGSGRIVYGIDDTKVLKLARNEKGIAQNEVEGDWYVNDIFEDIIAGVIERDENYRWIVSKRATKVTMSEFRHITGVDLKYFFRYVLSMSTPPHEAPHTMDKDVINKLDNLYFAQELIDLIRSTNLSTGDMDRLSTYGKINNKLVLVDYGLTPHVYHTHYVRR